MGRQSEGVCEYDEDYDLEGDQIDPSEINDLLNEAKSNRTEQEYNEESNLNENNGTNQEVEEADEEPGKELEPDIELDDKEVTAVSEEDQEESQENTQVLDAQASVNIRRPRRVSRKHTSVRCTSITQRYSEKELLY